MKRRNKYWLDTKNKWYLENVLQMDESAILPGAKHFLEEVRKAGYRTALGSASKNATTILEIVGMKSLFEVIINGNKTTRSKPDPQVFTMCAEALKIDYTNCVVFEDAEAGIEAALRAGMFAIGIGDSKVLTKAGFVVKDLSEMNLEMLPF